MCRTYPKGYKPPDEEPSEYQTIPLNKIEDFGVHCKQYYSLDVQYFKSAMDKVSLWGPLQAVPTVLLTGCLVFQVSHGQG